VHGGVFFYRGSGRGAAEYVQRDTSLAASRYYLAEGAGLAERMVVNGAGRVTASSRLDKEQYQAWVEGFDPQTGEAKGRLRSDAAGVRFCEVTVNGPKSWSIAAALHSDISAAYDAAQDEAVGAIGRFLGRTLTARVGGRGQQQQLHVDEFEMSAVRHYTSRAGDPHRHIHLQVNTRVRVGDKWYGLHTVGVRRMTRAINGVGHRAVMANPGFRQALAAHGFTMRVDGEIEQLAQWVKPMSKRSEQVRRNVDAFYAKWQARYPGKEPPADFVREWDLKAWNKERPKKSTGASVSVLEDQWLQELRGMGADVDGVRRLAAVPVTGTLPGEVDRVALAHRAVDVVAAGSRGRSAWNEFDMRGVAEELLAEQHLYGHDQVVSELAEDVTDRALQACRTTVPDRAVVPADVRHWTSDQVVQMERDIKGRMAARAVDDAAPAPEQQVRMVMAREDRALDVAQAEAVRQIGGTGKLVVVEGPAGAGKTTMLVTARDVIREGGGRMIVVAPTRKAANVAAEELDTDTDTAAALAYAHGYRWDHHGVWQQLRPGDRDPVSGEAWRGVRSDAKLRPTDVLVVDEADLLNQETAQAMLHIADDAGCRVVMVGDRRQLTAVGRGGVLSMAARYAPAHVTLGEVHRFRTPDGGRDEDYADLSLRMRDGRDAAATFDRLVDRGNVVVHRTEQGAVDRVAEVAAQRVLAGDREALSVATNDLAAAINEQVRDHLVSAGHVDDGTTAHGSDGLRIGQGDRVMTRQNDHQRDVTNRAVWTVNQVHPDGSITVEGVGRKRHQTWLDAEYVREHTHLAYASTTHAVQGETSTHGTLVLTGSTDHAAAYVGMTRGKETNTVHIVATNLDDAREQWVEAADRNRSDLGLDKAAREARRDVDLYADEPVGRPHRDLTAEELRDRIHGAVDEVELRNLHEEELRRLDVDIAEELAQHAWRDDQFAVGGAADDETEIGL
jgi:conjugative relaxase-like TrwC/TraI family protein